MLRSGVKLVIAGAPNVGKSSLLNRLARTDSAIVTGVPGTTRDVVRERVVIAGIPFDVHDTAGLRETSDPVERIGVERASDAIDDADLVLLVVDDRDAAGDAVGDAVGDALPERAAAAPARILVRNKIDLSGAQPGIGTDREGVPMARVSALEGSGLAELEEAIVERVMRGTAACEDAFMARRRHVDALERALAAVDRAQCRLTVDKARRARRRGASRRAGRARRDHRRVRDRGSPRAHLLELLYREVRGGDPATAAVLPDPDRRTRRTPTADRSPGRRVSAEDRTVPTSSV